MAGYKYQGDDELDESTNKWMLWGGVLMLAMAAVFPLYRWFEPSSRDATREDNLSSLASHGEELWAISCSSCHGVAGGGGIGPALNSEQFLQSATDDQVRLLTSVGIPGSQMGAYSQDFGGPLTSEQIRALQIFIRSWEPNAPDFPEWRDMMGG